MQSFFNGLAGMFNFSKGLDNVSNNISNMNTPGFRGNDVFMRSLGGDNDGYGATVEEKSIRTQKGDLKQTGIDTDLAINGDGYFTLKDKNGNFFYTRAGQFKFDSNNVLIDSASGMSVMGINSAGGLSAIDITKSKTFPPEPTTQVDMLGNLPLVSTAATNVADISVFDSTGVAHKLSATFTQKASPDTDTYTVSVKDPNGVELTNFDIKFNPDSSISTASTSVAKTLTLGTLTQSVTFNFASARQTSGTASMSANVKDGHDTLGLRSLAFDDSGTLQFTYANGKTQTGQQVGLAVFTDPSVLQSTSHGLYKANAVDGLKYGQPSKAQFGAIQSKSIEMSNVDLTQEFADILIIQRGYQASSRVMSVSNDLLDQLYNSTRTK